jgi:hypothetical protein
MNLFKSFTLHWWQGGIFKIAMISLGLAIGLTWPEFFIALRPVFWGLFIVLAAYITCVWWKQ